MPALGMVLRNPRSYMRNRVKWRTELHGSLWKEQYWFRDLRAEWTVGLGVNSCLFIKDFCLSWSRAHTHFFNLGTNYFYFILLFVLLFPQQIFKIIKHENLIFFDSHIFMWLQKSSNWREFISDKDTKTKKKKSITSPFISENYCIYIYMYKMFLTEALKFIINYFL